MTLAYFPEQKFAFAVLAYLVAELLARWPRAPRARRVFFAAVAPVLAFLLMASFAYRQHFDQSASWQVLKWAIAEIRSVYMIARWIVGPLHVLAAAAIGLLLVAPMWRPLVPLRVPSKPLPRLGVAPAAIQQGRYAGRLVVVRDALIGWDDATRAQLGLANRLPFDPWKELGPLSPLDRQRDAVIEAYRLVRREALPRVAEREPGVPTLEAMAAEVRPFSGVLFAGLMLTSDGPKLIEFNARMGDPETEAVLMRLDSDLAEIFEALVDHRIGTTQVNWSNDSSVCIVAASGGYPGEFEKGKPITGLDEAKLFEGVMVFHAGTASEQGVFRTNGGRVLAVAARANTLQRARQQAYEAVGRIRFDGIHYRTDIAS